jgi:D-alanyl-D-alanine carboxypeptidase
MGMKTGFLCASGFNVVAAASRGGRRLVAVVLGAMSGAERTVKAARLLDAGFASRENLGTLEMLPSSGNTIAPNNCEAVRHRGAPLSEESEVGLPTAQNFERDGGNPAYAFLLQSGHNAPQTSMITHNASGRAVLVPRDAFVPIPVYLGAAPGSSAPVLAAQPPASAITTQPALPASAMALTEPGAPLSLSASKSAGNAKSARKSRPAARKGHKAATTKKAPPAAKADQRKADNGKAGKAHAGKAHAGKAHVGKTQVGKAHAGKAKAAAAQ